MRKHTIKIDDADIRVETYSLDTWVRIVHLPTGLVVTCQNEKSRSKNHAKALQRLARLLLTEENVK